MLPRDPGMLLSIINMKLRDEYSSFDELINAYDDDKEEILCILDKAGYKYVEDLNQFKGK